jgi:hypothetical protein
MQQRRPCLVVDGEAVVGARWKSGRRFDDFDRRVVTEQQPGGGRAEMGQGDERAAAIADRHPGKVPARRGKLRLASRESREPELQ